jgi:chemotaxis methyl-accepting protein methylase
MYWLFFSNGRMLARRQQNKMFGPETSTSRYRFKINDLIKRKVTFRRLNALEELFYD